MITEKEIYREHLWTAVFDPTTKYRMSPRGLGVDKTLEEEMLEGLFILQEMPYLSLEYCSKWDETIVNQLEQPPVEEQLAAHKEFLEEVLTEKSNLYRAIHEVLENH